MPAELHVGWNEAAPTGAGKSATVKMLLQHGDNTTTSNKRTAHLASDRAYRPFSAPPPRPCRRPPVFHFALVLSGFWLCKQTPRLHLRLALHEEAASVLTGATALSWGHVN